MISVGSVVKSFGRPAKLDNPFSVKLDSAIIIIYNLYTVKIERRDAEKEDLSSW